MIRSRRSASYQPVENGEYEALESEGFDPFSDIVGALSDRNIPPAAVPNRRRDSSTAANGAPMVRHASSEGSVALSHPTPDLQSIQGAYIGNIERLEQSAERLSLNSDLDEEIRKLKQEQKLSESRRSSIKAPSRHYSTNSLSNSVRSLNRVARTGGFSPEAYVASPIGSMMSPPWAPRSAQEHTAPPANEYSPRSEPEKEGLPLDSPISIKPTPLTVRNSNPMELEEQEKEGLLVPRNNQGDALDAPERTASAASGDTFQRASKAFEDFDGVHIQSGNQDLPENDGEGPQDIDIPPESPRVLSVRSSVLPQSPAENMVFYPAPVPMMLNLPKRLSRAPPASKVAQRKSEILQAAMTNNRKSMPMLGQEKITEEGSNHPSESTKRGSELPPQLRATMFFDHNPVQHDIEVKQGSAVATLDSILDASAHAPVNAFTDHPMVGQLGNEVYGSSPDSDTTKVTKVNRRSRNSAQLLGDRKSTSPLSEMPNRGISMVLEERERREGRKLKSPIGDAEDEGNEDHEITPLRGSMDEEDAERGSEEEEDDEAEDQEEDIDGTVAGRPTTLLAELQLRKAQQKQRNRTAATAFPNGMHSTLLQLDAVAQVQKSARQQKHVTLAWEDADAAHPQDTAADDDVPLAILYPGRAAQALNDPAKGQPWDEDRPLGLLAQRAMEDSEPLSRRRARLLGGPAAARSFDEAKRASSLNLLSGAGTAASMQRQGDDGDGGEDGETLAQRKQRLRNQRRIDEPRAVSGDFASEMLSQLGGGGGTPRDEDTPDVTANGTSKTPDPEETLGQRRKRLLAEKEAAAAAAARTKPAAVVRVRRSMADMLQANPVGVQHGTNAPATGIAPHGLVGTLDNWRPALHSTPSYGTQAAYGNVYDGGGYAHGSYVNPMAYTPMMGLQGAAVGASPDLGFPESASVADQLALDPKQRAMIDRWRQSVV